MNFSRALVTLGVISGLALVTSSAMAAAQSIEASVDLSDGAVTQTTWTPVTGLTTNLADGAKLGQFDIQLNDATSLEMTQTSPAKIEDAFSLNLDGGTGANNESILAIPVIKGQKHSVKQNMLQLSDLQNAVQIELQAVGSNVMKPGHYTANFDITSYAG